MGAILWRFKSSPAHTFNFSFLAYNGVKVSIIGQFQYFMEKEIGKVVHYFDKVMVAVVSVSEGLAVGDTVKFVYGDSEFTQKVESMQIEHKPVDSVKAGEEVAIKVNEKTHENAKIYKVEE